MEGANGTTNWTVGCAKNLTLQVSDVSFTAHTYVIKHASFELLLSRPFQQAAQCRFEDLPSGKVEVSVQDLTNLSRRVFLTTRPCTGRAPSVKSLSVLNHVSLSLLPKLAAAQPIVPQLQAAKPNFCTACHITGNNTLPLNTPGLSFKGNASFTQHTQHHLDHRPHVQYHTSDLTSTIIPPIPSCLQPLLSDTSPTTPAPHSDNKDIDSNINKIATKSISNTTANNKNDHNILDIITNLNTAFDNNSKSNTAPSITSNIDAINTIPICPLDPDTFDIIPDTADTNNNNNNITTINGKTAFIDIDSTTANNNNIINSSTTLADINTSDNSNDSNNDSNNNGNNNGNSNNNGNNNGNNNSNSISNSNTVTNNADPQNLNAPNIDLSNSNINGNSINNNTDFYSNIPPFPGIFPFSDTLSDPDDDTVPPNPLASDKTSKTHVESEEIPHGSCPQCTLSDLPDDALTHSLDRDHHLPFTKEQVEQMQRLRTQEPKVCDSDDSQRPTTAYLSLWTDHATTHKSIGLPQSVAFPGTFSDHVTHCLLQDCPCDLTPFPSHVT